MPGGYVDALRPWGSDFSLTPTGDIQLIQDTPSSPAATIQRVIRLIQMVPLLFDDAGNPITEPTDWFNVNYGSGVTTLIGQNPTKALISGIQTRILAGLALDPYISTSPPPSVTATANQTTGFVTVMVSCTTITGQPITVPPQQLPILNAA